MSTFLAIDPANCSGVALFRDGVLVKAFTVKPRGGKGAWYCGDCVYENRRDAWFWAYGTYANETGHIDAVVIERGFGGMATAVRSQGKHIGWHECMCAQYEIQITEVNVSEWRRVIAEAYSVSWPKDSERCKALSVQLATSLYPAMEFTADESDAVLLGLAALRMRLVA
jgi:hypothetical protein